MADAKIDRLPHKKNGRSLRRFWAAVIQVLAVIVASIRNFTGSELRFQIIQLPGGRPVVDDNSNSGTGSRRAKDSMRLEGKAAIVTGAGRGIGRAIAAGYAREGASVIVNYSRSEVPARELAARICRAGGKAAAVRADVADPAQQARLIQAALDEFGRLDILVNNAAIEIREPALEPTPDTWRKTIGVNIEGAYFLSAKAAAVMARSRGGKIINISSIHDFVPLRQRAVYSITKGGMMMMTKSLALEFAEHNIQVNSISPGAILTDMNRESLAQPGRTEWLLQHIPAKRIGEPEDLVGAAVFLASAESNYVTGTTIYIDGGLLLQG
jgi:glucose 1-dehydrogenase